jgi:hypothetical protein
VTTLSLSVTRSGGVTHKETTIEVNLAAGLTCIHPFLAVVARVIGVLPRVANARPHTAHNISAVLSDDLASKAITKTPPELVPFMTCAFPDTFSDLACGRWLGLLGNYINANGW